MHDKYFSDASHLNQLLIDYQEIFDLLDDLSQQLLRGIITTSEQFREVLNQATGAYGVLEPLYSQAVAVKTNEELRYYVEKKAEIEARNEKVVAASLEKESSEHVANYRRIRNILEAYVLLTEKLIMTAQTQLKRIESDSKYKPMEEA